MNSIIGSAQPLALQSQPPGPPQPPPPPADPLHLHAWVMDVGMLWPCITLLRVSLYFIEFALIFFLGRIDQPKGALGPKRGQEKVANQRKSLG